MNVGANQLKGWIPIRLYWNESTPVIDWCWVGTRRFTDPFFSQTIDATLRLPFSTLFRPQTPIDTLQERHEIESGMQPRGFIFHMSRCGSTLVSQMLASLPRSVVIAEAGPIDSVLRAHFQDPSLTEEMRAQWLKWMISGLGQRRDENAQYLFIKFDTWSVFDLPLIHRTYPGVPWIFLYRDPIDVLVSQFEQRGAHMVPGAIEPELFGMTLDEVVAMEPEEYCSSVLARVCEAALQHSKNYGGMLINYLQLPEAVRTHILDLFGVEVSVSEMEVLERVAMMDSKNPSFAFVEDSKRNKKGATEAMRAAVAKFLSPIYEQLEAVRLGT